MADQKIDPAIIARILDETEIEAPPSGGFGRTALCNVLAPAAGGLAGFYATAPSAIFSGWAGPVAGAAGGAELAYYGCHIGMDYMTQGHSPTVDSIGDMVNKTIASQQGRTDTVSREVLCNVAVPVAAGAVAGLAAQPSVAFVGPLGRKLAVAGGAITSHHICNGVMDVVDYFNGDDPTSGLPDDTSTPTLRNR